GTFTATWTAQVLNPGGVTSNVYTFMVQGAAITPFIANVSPVSYPASSSLQTMTINGSNFLNGASLTFDPPTGANFTGNPVRLTFVSSAQLIYQFNSTVAGTWTVTVNNPDGQPSNAFSFTVTGATPQTPIGTGPGSASSPGPITGSSTVTMSWNSSSG